MRRLTFLTIALFFLFPSPFQAQDNYRQRFVNYTLEEGLASTWNFDIIQDSAGYIWIAGQNGLSRFDGLQFRNFYDDPEDSTSLAPSWVMQMAPDAKGGLWALTFDKHINYFDPETEKFRVYQKPLSDPPTPNLPLPKRIQSRALLLDESGALWTSYWERLLRFDPETENFESYAYPFDQVSVRPFIQTIISDRNNPDLLWVGTSGGLYSFDKGAKKFRAYPQEVSLDIFSLDQDLDGRLWVASCGEGLWFLQNDKWTNIPLNFPPEMDAPPAVQKDLFSLKCIDGQVWAGTAAGVVVFQPESGDQYPIFHNDGSSNPILSGQVEKIFQDKQGRVWLATFSGLSLFDQRRKVFHLEVVDLAYWAKKRGAAEGADGDVFYIVEDRLPGQIKKFSLKTEKYKILDVTSPDQKKPLRFTDIYRTKNGIFYLSVGNNRLFRFFPERNRIESVYSNILDSIPIEIQQIAQDQYDNLVLVGKNKAVTILPGRELPFVFVIPTLSSNWPIVDYHQSYVVADTGFYQIDPQNRKVIYLNVHPDPGNSANIIKCIWRDKDDSVWLISNKNNLLHGRITKGRFALTSQFKGHPKLKGSEIRRIRGDDQGNLWLFSNKGLIRFRIADHHFKVYDKDAGLLNVNLEASFIDQVASGRILFFNDGYLAWMNPEELSSSATASPLILNEITILNSLYEGAAAPNYLDRLTLSHRQNVFSISFQAINHTDPLDHQYAYKLEGFDEDWQEVGNRNTAYYTNIPSGDYRFRVKTANSDGVWRERGKILSISVTPPYWERWWFQSALFLALLAVLVSLYRYRIRQVRREEAMKRDYGRQLTEMELQALRSQMNPHFMFNSLNSIKNFILKNKTLDAADYLSRFSHLIRLILQLSREKMVPLSAELEALLLYIELEQLRFGKKFELIHEIDEQINPLEVQIPPLILQPYVENAIWHGLLHKKEQGSLWLLFEKREKNVYCIIEDNGVGREKAAELKSKTATRYKSLGMGITQSRIALHNRLSNLGISAEIIDKRNDQGRAIGTKVIIRIPARVSEDLVQEF